MLSTAGSRPKSRLRQAREAAYAAVILEAAEEVFGREGYEGAKVQEVAREAGISLNTLYDVFPGKVELWRALHEQHLSRLFESALSTLRSADPDNVLDQLLTGIGGYVRYLVSHPKYLRLHLSDGSAWALGTGMRSEEQIEAWARGKRLVAELVARGIEQGVLVDEDPELVVQIMLALHQVRLAHWLHSGCGTPQEEVVRQIQEHTIRALHAPATLAKALARFRKRGNGK